MIRSENYSSAEKYLHRKLETKLTLEGKKFVLLQLYNLYNNFLKDNAKTNIFLGELKRNYPIDEFVKTLPNSFAQSFDLIKRNSLDNSQKVILDSEIPGFELKQNYPNPFNPTTKISYSIQENGQVTIKIFDSLGQAVKTLVNENKTAGSYTIVFDASNLPSGIYYYNMRINNYSKSKQMLLLK